MQTRAAGKRSAQGNASSDTNTAGNKRSAKGKASLNAATVYIAVYQWQKPLALWTVNLGKTDGGPYNVKVDKGKNSAQGHIDAPCTIVLGQGALFNAAFGTEVSRYNYAYYSRLRGRTSKLLEQDPHFGMQKGDMVEDTEISKGEEAFVSKLRKDLGIEGELPKCVHVACVQKSDRGGKREGFEFLPAVFGRI